MNELALFAGAGGGILGGAILGWQTVCAVEIDAYCAGVLLQRQNDGILQPFPIWDDVCTFDGKPWRGIVDVVSGGFPCQDISAAGKGEGITGERSGLWVEMARIIGEVRPRYAFVENSPVLTSRGLGVVLGDLAAMGFNASWGVLGAADVGAPHLRERIWIVANASGGRCNKPGEREIQQSRGAETQCSGAHAADADGELIRKLPRRRDGQGRTEKQTESSDNGKERNIADADGKRELQPERGELYEWRRISDCGWWESEPNLERVVYGVPKGVDRIRCLGNAQVPQCAAEAWRILSE